jgi:hypothetical protein
MTGYRKRRSRLSWLVKKTTLEPVKAPGRPTMKMGGALLVPAVVSGCSTLFGEDQFACPGTLQAVHRAVVLNVHRFVAPQQVFAGHNGL